MKKANRSETEISEAVIKILKGKRIKCTNQRIWILCEMLEKKYPKTAEEIYSGLSLKGFRISLSTVYRVLEVLNENQIVNKHILSDGKGTCYELERGETGHSHSIICTGCRKTVQVKECPVDSIAAKLLETEGFEITEHNIQIYGKCKNCRKQE